jgi:hypothetical protein
MGLNRACPWLQGEDGGPDWGIPRGTQEVSSGDPWLHEAGRGHLAELWFFDHRHRGDGRELTAIRLALNRRGHLMN